MACTFGTHLLASYNQAVHDARTAGSTTKKQALADVAQMALITHQGECSHCGAEKPSVRTLSGNLRRLFPLPS